MAPICLSSITLGLCQWMRRCSTRPCPALLSLVSVCHSVNVPRITAKRFLTVALIPDCVIRPDVGRPATTTSINHVLQAGRNTLSELDADIQSGQDESSRLEMSREYLQQLLDGEQLTEL